MRRDADRRSPRRLGRLALRPALACVALLWLATAAGAATLRAVRQITTPLMTRVIVEFSEPVHYRLQRVSGHPDLGVPARVYVDFPGTEIAAGAVGQLDLREGPLLRLRATRPAAATTRLILDVPGLTDFGAFPMPDPFRLIIDVRGTPRTAPPRPAAAPPPPSPQPTAARQARGAARPSPPAAVPAPAAQRAMKIVLDPGHGGKDPGAIGVDGVAEKDVVLAIAQRLRARLAATPDVEVVLTRDSDVFLALEERTARANAEQADVFVSIHANASPNAGLSGVETYYLNNTNDRATIRLAEMENGLRSVTGNRQRERDVALILSDLIQSYKIQESVLLAEQVQRDLVTTLDTHRTPANNLGVKRGPFYVLVGAGMPCVLVEVAFLTHPVEGGRLAQPDYQDTIAEGLLRGIRRFVENARAAENL